MTKIVAAILMVWVATICASRVSAQGERQPQIADEDTEADPTGTLFRLQRERTDLKEQLAKLELAAPQADRIARALEEAEKRAKLLREQVQQLGKTAILREINEFEKSGGKLAPQGDTEKGKAAESSRKAELAILAQAVGTISRVPSTLTELLTERRAGDGPIWDIFIRGRQEWTEAEPFRSLTDAEKMRFRARVEAAGATLFTPPLPDISSCRSDPSGTGPTKLTECKGIIANAIDMANSRMTNIVTVVTVWTADARATVTSTTKEIEAKTRALNDNIKEQIDTSRGCSGE